MMSKGSWYRRQSKTATRGIYGIFLRGTPFVYVGLSECIEQRWPTHAKDWVWPNDADYCVLERLGEYKPLDLLKAEARWHRIMKERGYWLLSTPSRKELDNADNSEAQVP